MRSPLVFCAKSGRIEVGEVSGNTKCAAGQLGRRENSCPGQSVTRSGLTQRKIKKDSGPPSHDRKNPLKENIQLVDQVPVGIGNKTSGR